MFGQVWAVLKFLMELWNQLKIFLGMIEKAQHDHKQEEIKKETGVIADPSKSEEEKHEATKNLEDSFNSRA